MSEPEGRGAAWTEERRRSDEGRRRRESVPEANGRQGVTDEGAVDCAGEPAPDVPGAQQHLLRVRGRHSIGIDIDPEYCNLIEHRLDHNSLFKTSSFLRLNPAKKKINGEMLDFYLQVKHEYSSLVA